MSLEDIALEYRGAPLRERAVWPAEITLENRSGPPNDYLLPLIAKKAISDPDWTELRRHAGAVIAMKGCRQLSHRTAP
jgi:hypothetical protein